MNTTEKTVSQQGIELLVLCQQLQSEKDGIRRPAPGQTGVADGEVLDDFARQIQTACLYAAMTERLLGMRTRLAGLGRQLASQGCVTVHTGGDYAEAALDWLTQQCNSRAEAVRPQ